VITMRARLHIDVVRQSSDSLSTPVEIGSGPHFVIDTGRVVRCLAGRLAESRVLPGRPYPGWQVDPGRAGLDVQRDRPERVNCQ
jgi:hypothetical protein